MTSIDSELNCVDFTPLTIGRLSVNSAGHGPNEGSQDKRCTHKMCLRQWSSLCSQWFAYYERDIVEVFERAQVAGSKDILGNEGYDLLPVNQSIYMFA